MTASKDSILESATTPTTVKSSYRDIEVIAFIRFASDEITLKACLESISPAIKKGVLAYHKKCIYDDPRQNSYLAKEDKALEYALEFCKHNPGFKVAYYPHVIYPLQDKEYQNNQRPFQNTLAAFYEFTRLECLKLAQSDEPYLYKVDTDQIYDAEVISQQIELLNSAKEDYDIMNFCKYNVHYCPFEDELYFVRLVDVRDHFIFKGKEYTFDNKKLDDGRTYEVLMGIRKCPLTKLFKQLRLCAESKRYLKLPTFKTEDEYLAAKAQDPTLDLAIYKAKKYKSLEKVFKKKRVYPRSFCCFAHFVFINKALDWFVETIPGYPSAQNKKDFNLIPYQEFYHSEQFKLYCKQYPELGRDFYREENLKTIARSFNFAKYQDSIEAFKKAKRLNQQ